MKTHSMIDYILHLADNALIHGHRLSEWCGHGPVLEVDIALTNISLDSIGAARSFYQYAAEIEGGGKTEDSYPYFRDVRQFRNILLVEMPKGDFADTLAKCLFFDAYQFLFYTALKSSTDSQLAAIAEKSLKEVTYHLKFSREWTVRLGDGTEESKERMQRAIHDLWAYTGEMFVPSESEKEMIANGIGPDITQFKSEWEKIIAETLEEATLNFPISIQGGWHQSGGKIGVHTEHLGFILTEMQYLQKSYPGNDW